LFFIVTDAVLRRTSVNYRDHTLNVTEYVEKSSRGHEADSVGDDDGRAVKIRDIPETMSYDVLYLLFENSNKSGGGEIEQLDYTSGCRDAVVTFKDAEGLMFF
jgi:hypothetical protein